jgi:ABC-type lipoprotein export system ATPase subunit
MGIPVLIIGKSGSGKSTSLRNFKENERIYDKDDIITYKELTKQNIASYKL